MAVLSVFKLTFNFLALKIILKACELSAKAAGIQTNRHNSQTTTKPLVRLNTALIEPKKGRNYHSRFTWTKGSCVLLKKREKTNEME